MSNLNYKGFYKRNLPHWQPLGGTLFVTCCLAGSIPRTTLEWYRKEKQRFIAQSDNLSTLERAEFERELQRKWFARIEGALHKAETGPTWLKSDVARLVAENFHFHDGKTYRLDAYCIMPNHTHLVFAPLEIEQETQAGSLRYVKEQPKYFALAKIMHTMKSYTANRGNALLNREGEFWQHESYDHSIRDHQEWQRIIDYVLSNPVKAGFTANWQDWPFTYLRKLS